MTKETNWKLGLSGMMPKVHPDDEQALIARLAEKAREAIEEFDGVSVQVCAFQAGTGEPKRSTN